MASKLTACVHCSQIGEHGLSCVVIWAKRGGPPFVAVHDTIVRAGQVVGRMVSKTMAKRTANALNRHTPNREGV